MRNVWTDGQGFTQCPSHYDGEGIINVITYGLEVLYLIVGVSDSAITMGLRRRRRVRVGGGRMGRRRRRYGGRRGRRRGGGGGLIVALIGLCICGGND